MEEALIEMYMAGVSVRRVEDITEALWGSKVSPATISELNKKAYVHIEDWRNRPLQGGKYPYVYVDGIYPVSYTHLDVYKRQIMYRIGGRLGSAGVSLRGVAGGIPLLICWVSNLRP